MTEICRKTYIIIEASVLFLCATFNGLSASELNVTVSDVTTTTITLTWELPQDMLKHGIWSYNMWVKYNRQTVQPDRDNKECSVSLSKCILRNLEPGTTYNIDIRIGNQNRTIGAQFKIVTYQEQDKALNWWLMYVVAPSVAGIVFVLVTVLCCKACRCCCWREKQLIQASRDGSKKSTMRLESQTTRQWIQDTVKAMPATATVVEGYDQPAVVVTGRSIVQKEGYLPISQSPPHSFTAEIKQTLKRDGSLRCGKPPPASPPPCAPAQYVNTGASEPSSPQNLYANSDPAFRRTQSDSKRRQLEKVDAHLYTNTEDASGMLGNNNRMFLFP
ncbi:hypothetical protein Btru_023905 [Bulinus truncatus]|nr:hypothetical protein Btru_023905 [Bulinus truncatus]